MRPGLRARRHGERSPDAGIAGPARDLPRVSDLLHALAVTAVSYLIATDCVASWLPMRSSSHGKHDCSSWGIGVPALWRCCHRPIPTAAITLLYLPDIVCSFLSAPPASLL